MLIIKIVYKHIVIYIEKNNNIIQSTTLWRVPMQMLGQTLENTIMGCPAVVIFSRI